MAEQRQMLLFSFTMDGGIRLITTTFVTFTTLAKEQQDAEDFAGKFGHKYESDGFVVVKDLDGSVLKTIPLPS